MVLNFPKYYVSSLGKAVDGGTDYIERNAFVLIALINKLKQELVDNNSTAKIKIVGPSMGGLISRYALAYMEKNNMPHNTDMWISFDSPHNGANIPIGAQQFLEYYAGTGNKGAQEALNHQLDNPAAKQLLLHHFKSNSALAQGAPGFRDRFVTALTSNGLIGSNGFPTVPRKVCVVDGSLNGTLQSGVGACQKALEMNTKVAVKWMFLFKVRLFTVAAANVYLAGSYGNSCKVFDGSRLLKQPRTDYGHAPSSSVSYDIAPGGTFNTLKVLADESGDDWFGSNTTQYILNQVLINIVTSKLLLGVYGTDTKFTVYTATHAFIPTKSALAWKTTNANQDLAENVYDRNLVCRGEIPFDTYYGGLTNLEHVEITPDIARFTIDEIEGRPQQPTFQSSIPNLTISGPTTFCPSGNYSITGGTLPSGTSIVWNPGPIASVGSGQYTTQARLDRISNGTATMTVALTKTCGINQTLQKTYTIGGYGSSDYLITNYPSSAGCGQYVTYTTNTLPGATNYAWFYPGYPWTYVSGQGTPSLTLQTPSSGSSGSYQIGVRVANACDAGGSPAIVNTYFTGCFGAMVYEVSPNPATSEVTVAPPNEAESSNTTDAAITAINIYDQQGTLKKQQKFGKVKTARVNVSDLSTGLYFIEIVDTNHSERHQLSVLR